MPNTGPIDGWRITQQVPLPIRLSAWLMPTVCTVLPSPSGVGVIAVTTMYLPCFCAGSSSRSSLTLALLWPYGSRSSSVRPITRATSDKGRSGMERAISRSFIDMVGRAG